MIVFTPLGNSGPSEPPAATETPEDPAVYPTIEGYQEEVSGETGIINNKSFELNNIENYLISWKGKIYEYDDTNNTLEFLIS